LSGAQETLALREVSAFHQHALARGDRRQHMRLAGAQRERVIRRDRVGGGGERFADDHGDSR
jgi:hypothetical protein